MKEPQQASRELAFRPGFEVGLFGANRFFDPKSPREASSERASVELAGISGGQWHDHLIDLFSHGKSGLLQVVLPLQVHPELG